MKKLFISYLNKHPKIILWGLTFITISALLLTLIPTDYISKSTVFSYDKIGHVLLFGSWTFFLGLYNLVKNPKGIKLWEIFVLGVLFGGGIELLQHFLPVNRQGDIFDFGMDVVGALGAIILLNFLPTER